MKDFWEWLLSMNTISLIVGVIGIVVTIASFSERVQRILLLVFGGKLFTPRTTGIAGIWVSAYIYESGGNKKTDYHIFEITQFKRRYKGYSLSRCYGDYYLEGVVDNDLFVSGSWESRIKRDKHTGAFHMVSNVYGNKLSGKWLGFNRFSKIQDGPIEFRFFENKLSRKEIKNIRNISKEELKEYLQYHKLWYVPES